MDYVVEIYKLLAYLTSQIRRAVYSIPLNIAEGADCESQKEVKLFLEYAPTSTHEVLTILDLLVLAFSMERLHNIMHESPVG